MHSVKKTGSHGRFTNKKPYVSEANRDKRPRGKGKYLNTGNTKKGNSNKKQIVLQMKGTSKQIEY